MDVKNDARITSDLQLAINMIDKELDGFDYKDSGNYGINENGNLVLIDYGMTKKLYEKEWVPLAQKGIIPQIHFQQCTICKLEKELRMYGEADTDIRCVDCGKI
ncbi:hypothetical protein [Metasolibacillus meyeri]|uniref:hypothetical protein n=1 Tax=Metasolibacillus meyeri TaxID=1071052 RepID=UPI000D30D08F|nr:hypothetical protein [Metasolibacillus meyeri]